MTSSDPWLTFGLDFRTIFLFPQTSLGYATHGKASAGHTSLLPIGKVVELKVLKVEMSKL